MEIDFTLDEIHDAAAKCLDSILLRKVVAVSGEMGAGKTTFIHAVCDVLKVSSVVGSPTYSIINEYVYPGGKIYHMDLYRLKDEEEAAQAGVEDSLYSGNICFVEWPERAPAILPEHTLHVYLEPVNVAQRRITVVDN